MKLQRKAGLSNSQFSSPLSIPEPPRTVILLHGIGHSRYMMATLDYRLRQTGFKTVNISYPSRKLTIAECAEFIHQYLAEYPPHSLDFVTHSMGGLILRSYIQQFGESQIHRIVFIGTPHQGSSFARRIKGVVGWYFGPSFTELADANYVRTLPTPKANFINILGRNHTHIGFNPLIPGDNDFCVAVHEGELPGASYTLFCRLPHALLPQSPWVFRQTRDFLLGVSSECRQSISVPIQ